jgi:phenylalanyl-tRNA synthetase alpha chain
MIEKIEEIKTAALAQLEGVDNTRDLESWRVQYLGKKSLLTRILRNLASLSIEERKAVGAAANKVKSELEGNARDKNQTLREAQLKSSTTGEIVDISLPGRPFPVGHLHPMTRTIEEVSEIFVSLGFQVIDGPEVEWDYYNFEALNIPPEHPSRDDYSTYFIDAPAGEKGKQLLRTHTTSITARTLETYEPPIRAVEIGKCYRYEATDATHLNIFHHADGIAVDKRWPTSRVFSTSFRDVTSDRRGKSVFVPISSPSWNRGEKSLSTAMPAKVKAVASAVIAAGWRSSAVA